MNASKIIIDLPGVLDLITALDGWKEASGPDSGTGLDYWYVIIQEGNDSPEHEAYINIDQTWMTVDVDGETMYSGDFTEDDSLRPFWREENISAPDEAVEPPE